MFEHLSGTPPRTKRSRFLPIVFLASLFHAALFGVLMVRRPIEIAEAEPESKIRVTFAQMAPSSPPPAAGLPDADETPRIEEPPESEVLPMPTPEKAPAAEFDAPEPQIIAPQIIPEELEDLQRLPTPHSARTQRTGPKGLREGTGNSSAAPTRPFQVGNGVTAPIPIQKFQPAYPRFARNANVEGTVILRALIRKDGLVENVKVVQGLPLGCTEAAVEAIKKRRYKPALFNGTPVACYLEVRIDFKLRGGEEE